MRVILDGDARWKIEFLRKVKAAAFHRLGEIGGVVEVLGGERLLEASFDGGHVALVGHGLVIAVANAKDVEDQIVAPRENVGAENVQLDAGKGAGDAREQLFTVPSAEVHFAVARVRMRDPFDRRRQRGFVARVTNGEEAFGTDARARRHRRRRRSGSIVPACSRSGPRPRRGNSRQLSAHRFLEVRALDDTLPIERFTVGEIEFGLAVKLPNQRLLPIAPILVASALAIASVSSMSASSVA
jgi:hypothetical protein